MAIPEPRPWTPSEQAEHNRGVELLKSFFKGGRRVTHRVFVRPDEMEHKICSVFYAPVSFNNPHGNIIVPACADGQAYSSAPVTAGYFTMDLGDNRWLKDRAITAKAVARDFIHADDPDSAFLARGLFVPEGPEPTEEELATARERLREWLLNEVQAADGDWQKFGKISYLTSGAREGVKRLGLKRDWANVVTGESTIDCPVCRAPMRKGALIHSLNDHGGCGARFYYADDTPIWADAPTVPAAAAPPPIPPPPADPPPTSTGHRGKL